MREINQRSLMPSKTLMAVAEDEAQVGALLAAARTALGGLDSRWTGYVVVLPVVRTEGLSP